ncbi:tetratricopeptide repeat protein [Capnocytophaga catalasegens]|nr:tetratricopeptide repeat protein [Capnocytophaga catalasegens]
MKKQILIASALMLTMNAFAQKKEMKEASKAIAKGDFSQAQSLLEQAKSGALADPKIAPEYHFLRGQLFVGKAKKNQETFTSLGEAAKSFAESEKLSKKYSAEIAKLKEEAVNIAVTQGQEAYKANNYKKAAPAFEQVYRLSPKDTVFLYNAAVIAVQDKDYDTALKHYAELKKLGYDGAETNYTAKNKETGQVETFPSKQQRDLMVKSGAYITPKEEKTPSKKAEIIKNIALIYVEQGKKEEALKAFVEARKSYPKDANLVIQEAYIYLQLENKDKFKELMQEAASLEPNNADIQYNIGVINLQQNHYEDARKAFQKALSIKPDYSDAALNISTTYINEGNALVEQMNALGNTKADIQKYDELKEKKDGYFKQAASVLEDFIKKQGKNADILEQLKNIYAALGDTANFKRIKDML